MDVIRDISVILLAAEAFLCTLVPLVLFGAVVYGVWRLMTPQNLPAWLRTARDYVEMALSYVELGMDALARPIIAAHKACANVSGWMRAVAGGDNGRRRERGAPRR